MFPLYKFYEFWGWLETWLMNIFEEFLFLKDVITIWELAIRCLNLLGPRILFTYLEHEYYHFSYGVEFIEFKFVTLLSLSSLMMARDNVLLSFHGLRWGILYSRLKSFYWVFKDLVLFSSRFTSWRIRLKPRRFMIWFLGSVFPYFSLRGLVTFPISDLPPHGYP